MGTDQATLVLASLLRSPRRFQSFDLSGTAKQLVFALEKALEDYEHRNRAPDPPLALAALNGAYALLSASPPPAKAEALTSRKHPVLVAVDREDRSAEVAAWHGLLAEAAER